MKKNVVFKFRLYVAGDSMNSLKAVANLQALCQEHLAGRHAIEIVDVLQEPGQAAVDGIFLTPTLVKIFPAPHCKIIGNLSDTSTVLQTCGMKG